MNQTSWENERKKKAKVPWGLIVFLLSVSGTLLFLIRNNTDFFTSRSQTVTPATITHEVNTSNSLKTVDSDTLTPVFTATEPLAQEQAPIHTGKPTPAAKEVPVQGPAISKVVPQPAVALHNVKHTETSSSVQNKIVPQPVVQSGDSAEKKRAPIFDTAYFDLPENHCILYDRPDLEVIFACRLAYLDPVLRNELLLKRDDLRVMAKKALKDKTLDQVETKTLRLDCTNSFNSVLTTGQIIDMIFTDFRIEKVQKK